MLESGYLPDNERCRVALIGDSAIAMHCLRSLLAAGHTVVACFANGDAFYESACREGIKTFDQKTPLTVLAGIDCDWLISANNARLIPAEILAQLSYGAINFHDGPLPKYAGLYAPTRALLEGETEHGVTWHMVEGGIDTGAIIQKITVPIYKDDTSQTLNLRCLEAGVLAFDKLVSKLRMGSLIQQQEQDLTQRSYFGNKHWPREGMEVSWQWSAERILRIVRALDFGPFYNPVGFARFNLNDRWYRLLDARLCADINCPNLKAQAGTLRVAPGNILHVATSDSCLVATRVTPTITETTCRMARIAQIKPAQALAQIATWEEEIFKSELSWRSRLEGSLTNPESQKLKAVPHTSSAALGTTDYDLICGFLAWGLIFGTQQLRIGRWWTQQEINQWVGQSGDLTLASLLHPVAPILVEIDPQSSIRSFVDNCLSVIEKSKRQGPFFTDLLERGGSSRKPLIDPATLSIQWFSDKDGSAKVESTRFRIYPDSGNWRGTGSFNCDHINDLACELRKILKQQPSIPISMLPLLGPATETQVCAWENGESFVEQPTSFLVSIFNKLTDVADVMAIETVDGQCWTYRHLGIQVAALMNELRKAGVSSGDRVPIRLERSPELVAAQLAVMGLGAMFIPISKQSPILQVNDILQQISASVGIGAPINTSGTMTWLPAQIPCDQIEVDQSLECVVPVDNQIACIFFTSGSTGKPKGVRITHRGLDAYIEDSIGYFGYKTFSRSIWTSSVAFDSTLSEVIVSLVAGGTVVIPKAESVWSIRGFVESLVTHRITFIGISTTLWSAWMRDSTSIESPVPSTLQLVSVGGGVLHSELVEKWLSMAETSTLLCNGYGPTETTVVCTHYDIDRDSLSFPSIPIGYPNRGAKIRVLDAQQKRVAPGVTGEIVIGGLGVSDGYFDDSKQTFERFVELRGDNQKWYRTGDFGCWTNSGELLFQGRIDEQVKINGYRIEPEGISTAIRNLAGVKDAQVVAFGDEGAKELGAAVIRIAADDSTSDDKCKANPYLSGQEWTAFLQNCLKNELPPYGIPRRWLVVDELPRTVSEKN